MSKKTHKPPKRVLVAEDTEVVSHLMLRLLEEAGYEVALASDGEEALAQVAAFRPDLLLLDLMMPKLHGIEVLRRLRAGEEAHRLGVIVCTAKSFKTEHMAASELGAYAFLPKPHSNQQLLDVVAAYFAGLPAPADMAVASSPTGEAYSPDMETGRGRLAFWGTRGSIPTPGAAFMRHGGNTSCMQIEHGGEILVFDAGSGIRELGLELLQGPPRRVHLFITHTHWDHIQGFPFFTPAFLPGWEVVVYGAEGFGKSLEAVFRGQLDQDYFPVQMEDMNASIEFRHLTHEPVRVGDVTVTWEYAQHPGATVGYKIDVAGTVLSWFPDDEFLFGYLGAPEDLTLDDPRLAPYHRAVDFLSGVDILVHEAQYTASEYPAKVGWGHSSVSNAALLAKLAGVKRWIVTHHDPMHDDRFLEQKLNLTRQQLARLGHAIPVCHAYDGMVEFL
ncbi:MAG TPA: response regulator [Longimicrobiales bacterium]|nr:response regulator [Longimicrobiales bacterium]